MVSSFDLRNMTNRKTAYKTGIERVRSLGGYEMQAVHGDASWEP